MLNKFYSLNIKLNALNNICSHYIHMDDLAFESIISRKIQYINQDCSNFKHYEFDNKIIQYQLTISLLHHFNYLPIFKDMTSIYKLSHDFNVLDFRIDENIIELFDIFQEEIQFYISYKQTRMISLSNTIISVVAIVISVISLLINFG